jgi:hypothetical protein
MKARTPLRYTIRRLPYQVTAAVTIALAISFAAGAASVSPYAGPETQPAQSDVRPAIYVSPFEYFPGRYENRGTEVEPLPPTF